MNYKIKQIVHEVSVKVGCWVDLPFCKECISRLDVSGQCRLTYNFLARTEAEDCYIFHQQSQK